MEHCLFADAETGEEAIEHVLGSRLPRQPIYRPPRLPQLLGDDQQVDVPLRCLDMREQRRDTRALAGMKRLIAIAWPELRGAIEQVGDKGLHPLPRSRGPLKAGPGRITVTLGGDQ